jgi:hypothetical protein
VPITGSKSFAGDQTESSRFPSNVPTNNGSDANNIDPKIPDPDARKTPLPITFEPV